MEAKVENKTEFEADLCIVEGKIVFTDSGFDVPLESCASHKAMLEWVWHLAGQSWTSRGTIARFVELAAQHHNLELNRLR